MTDLGLRLLRKGKHGSNLMNYYSTSADGKPLRSSTFIIRNSRNQPIAFVCFNLDLSYLSPLREVIDSFFPVNLPTGDDILRSDMKETFPRDVQEILKSTVSEVLRKVNNSVNLMRKSGRLRVVELLDEAGVFAIKKAHYYVASVLGTSRYTIYNYLNETRKTKTANLNSGIPPSNVKDLS